MSIFAISDLHLSLNCDKTMVVFPGWENYVDRIKENWFKNIKDDDTVIIAGDISWAKKISEAKEDFKFIHELPGKKIITKGNHDYWWSTAAKFQKFCSEYGFENMFLLNNNSFDYGPYAICGTRGWFYDKNDPAAGDDKIFKRELLRLEASLKAAVEQGASEIDCFLHYPPVFAGTEVPQITEILSRYPVRRVFYGHLHGESLRGAFSGVRNGIYYAVVSADALGFRPIQIRE